MITQPNAMVNSVLKMRYFPRCSFLHAPVGFSPSYTWRSIHNASCVLKNGGFWRIGNGSDINICYDSWMPSRLGQCLWGPHAHHLTKAHVKDLIDHDSGDWNKELIDQYFLPAEAELIRRIPLPTFPQPDKFCWALTPCGLYSVRSGYYVALQIAIDGTNEEPNRPCPPTVNWKKLWSLPCQPKQLHFMWRLLNGTFPVRCNLIKRGVNCDTRCEWCGDNAETETHFFRDCPWIANAWVQSPLNLQDRKKLPVNLLLYAMVYGTLGIKRFFEARDIPLQSVFNKAFESIRHTNIPVVRSLDSSNHATLQETKWEAPSSGWYKVNCDAAMAPNSKWGIGIVARDSEGFVIAVAARLIHTFGEVALAEAMGLRIAMQFALDLSLEDVIFESDCKTVVDQVFKQKPSQLICWPGNPRLFKFGIKF
ncbi:Ribonuclease H-like superfamily [Sesbania bispinosa]|nr:Ribonuclease H-like superfamily [Sesbania bispinosa]